jgi:hypothetical protein
LDPSGDEEELAKLLKLVNGASSIISKSILFLTPININPLFVSFRISNGRTRAEGQG